MTDAIAPRARYHAIECVCSVRTAARPGIGVLSTVPGRSRDLLLSEACLVGPALATFISRETPEVAP